ncbi:MAG: serine hydrolase [Flavobacteriales bacterium]|jgi:CubicO group peptidase (beta-lactamase class C family)|nr:serine hydrolase [Flavobacteriales bacterium]
MKKALKYLLAIFIILNLLIVISGKSWLYKAVYVTYLKGHASSYINDYIHFPSNTIKDGNHQEWFISKDYNKAQLPEFIKPINDKLGTVAYMVIKKDSIIFEEYWNGYSADSSSNSFSMAKSWISTLVGIAIKEGAIESINQKACDFLPEFYEGDNSKITIKHLLTMSSGLDWDEDYHDPLGQTAEAYFALNLKGQMMRLKAVETPGEVFKYHSSCTQLLAFILENATGKSVNEYISEKLWKPMGSKHPALWNTDTKRGDEKAFCCINSNARDFARLGKLYMNQGNWNGLQILDSSYVIDATSIADLLDEKGNKNVNYGYQFWMTNYKNMHIYYTRGLWGQYVICIPDLDLIVVRLGQNYGRHLEDGHSEDFYQFIDAALEMYP